MDRNALFAGAGLGALLMFMGDPGRGARRRALVRHKAVRGARVGGRALTATVADLANRTRGVAANAWGSIRRESVDDDQLIERVRAALGHVCSHPRAIAVEAIDGEVTLRGDVLTSEANAVLAAARSVRGVSEIVDDLDKYPGREGVPSLQGIGRLKETSLDVLHRRWAPTSRALVGMAAAAAAAFSVAAYARRAA
ncbi:MAG TPA: BON domain-containing protein [Chthoniobacteraceae bacterium]|nr:BON domain-containing protein [Chthoniobacteraceae bacterium]